MTRPIHLNLSSVGQSACKLLLQTLLLILCLTLESPAQDSPEATKPEAVSSYTLLTAEQQATNTRVASLYGQLVGALNVFESIIAAEAADDDEWNDALIAVANARVRMDQAKTLFDIIDSKISPPDDAEDNKWFSFWNNRPSVRNLLNRILDKIERPVSELRAKADEMKDLFDETRSLQRAINRIDECDPKMPADSFPEALYDCRRCSRWSLNQLRVLENIFVVLEGLNGIVGALTDETIVAVGGGNVSAFRAIPESVLGIVRIIHANVNLCEGDINDAELAASYRRLEYIHYEMDTVQTDLVGLHAKMDSHILDFSEWKKFSVRLQIEINLAGHGSHPHPIAIFQLPEQFGGLLDEVRGIVRETIELMVVAGEDIKDAEKEYQRGDKEYYSENYKFAYEYYAQAYRAATSGRIGHR